MTSLRRYIVVFPVSILVTAKYVLYKHKLKYTDRGVGNDRKWSGVIVWVLLECYSDSCGPWHVHTVV